MLTARELDSLAKGLQSSACKRGLPWLKARCNDSLRIHDAVWTESTDSALVKAAIIPLLEKMLAEVLAVNHPKAPDFAGNIARRIINLKQNYAHNRVSFGGSCVPRDARLLVKRMRQQLAEALVHRATGPQAEAASGR